jgi:Protein of unknown function (DUF2934)
VTTLWIFPAESLAGREAKGERKDMSFEGKVKKIAYELYEKHGRREGRDLLDWLAAEQIIRFQQMILPGMSGEGVGLLEYKSLCDAGPASVPPVKTKTRSRKLPGGNPEAGGRA